MDGDSKSQKVSLLKKYDIPVNHLSYDYGEKCTDKKELERIIRILRCGEEGSYPDLLKFMEERLRILAPDSRVLRVETPVLNKESLTKEEWDIIEDELLSWEKEMNVLDKSLNLEESRMELVGNKNFPEIRKVEQKHKSLKAQENSKMTGDNDLKNKNINNNNSNNNNNNKRIKSGDYDAWDKYDVDKELLKIEVEEERKQEINEKKRREAKKLQEEKKIEIASINKENYSTMEQKVLANQAKDCGNECFKSGDFERALKYYEISVKLCPTAIAYNNRAMTYLKLKQFDKALEDSNKVLSLEKNNVKALYRRATAYQNMQSDKENHNFNELALQDLYKIVQLEPNNKAAQTDLQKLKKTLNIEDVGKKFRMSISEELANNMKSDQLKEKNFSHNLHGNNLSTDKLPLTYYGPSTSTFQCEPYSTVHSALSGSFVSGKILCKCNSNIPSQNFLCQKCGEAMCTPKPSKAAKTKSEVKIISNKDEERIQSKGNISDSVLSLKTEAKSSTENGCALKSQSEISKKKYNQQEEKPMVLKNQRECEDKIVKESGENDPLSQTESKKVEYIANDNLTLINVNNSENKSIPKEITNKKTAESHLEEIVAPKMQTVPSKSEEIKNTEIAFNKNNETVAVTNSTSQNGVNLNVKKSKKKKKKSKEVKETRILKTHQETLKMEPLRVVYASKYLHPTSVEPKIKSEGSGDLPQESAFSNTTQYKAFVPNRKCFSTENERNDSNSDMTVVNSGLKEPHSSPSNKDNSSSEINKENSLLNRSPNTVENGIKEHDIEKVETEAIDSAYEFITAWEQLKKLDESYVKRAEIIRKIRPTDLSTVIGIKLDSDMLSCILECLLRHLVEVEPRRVVELLEQLPLIPRFELVSMFLADSDKKNLKELIQVAEDKGFKLEEDVKKYLTAFR